MFRSSARLFWGSGSTSACLVSDSGLKGIKCEEGRVNEGAGPVVVINARSCRFDSLTVSPYCARTPRADQIGLLSIGAAMHCLQKHCK